MDERIGLILKSIEYWSNNAPKNVQDEFNILKEWGHCHFN